MDKEKEKLDIEAGVVVSKQRDADCFLAFCRTINVITGVSAVLCFIAQAMALAVGPPFSDWEWLNVQALRLYAMVCALVVLLTETEWPTFLHYFKFLESWLARGFLQSFLAVLTLQLAHPHGTADTDMDKSVTLYRTAAAYCMLACAGFYALGGVLCFSNFKEARTQRQQERQRVEKDLEALEKQREELHNLLASYSFSKG